MAAVIGVWITGTLERLGYSGLFVLMGLESAGVPLPAEVVLPFTGYLVYLHEFAFVPAIVIATLGSLAGFLFQYAIGRFGGRHLVVHYGPYLLILPEHVEKADRWFDHYGGRAVFIARLLPVVRGLISLPAGTARMRLLPFVLWSLLGAVPWTVLWVALGWGFGAYWVRVSGWAHLAGVAALVLVAAAGLFWWRRRRA